MADDPRFPALEKTLHEHMLTDARERAQIFTKLDALAEGQDRIEEIVSGPKGGPGLWEMTRQQHGRLDGQDQFNARTGAHLERVDEQIRALQAAPANDALEDRRLIRRTGLGEIVKLAIVGSIGGISVAVTQPIIAGLKGLFGGHP